MPSGERGEGLSHARHRQLRNGPPPQNTAEPHQPHVCRLWTRRLHRASVKTYLREGSKHQKTQDEQGQSGRSEKPEERRCRLEQSWGGWLQRVCCSCRNQHALTPSPACPLPLPRDRGLRVATGMETRQRGGWGMFCLSSCVFVSIPESVIKSLLMDNKLNWFKFPPN